MRNRLHNNRVEKIVFIYWNLRILRSLNWPLSVSELKKAGVIIEKEVSEDMIDIEETNTISSEDLIFEDGEWMLNEDLSFDYNEEDFEDQFEESFGENSEKNFED